MNFSGTEFPVNPKQYNRIEKQINININVFGYEEKKPFPIYMFKEKFEDQINILLMTEGGNKHYVLTKRLPLKFTYNQTKHQHRKHFCMYCLQCFSSEKTLNKHKENCMEINGKQAVK